MTNLYYYTFNSSFDSLTIIWKEINSDLRIQRIFLSDPEINSEKKARNSFEGIKKGQDSIISNLSKKIKKFLNGEDEKFELDLVDFSLCFKSQINVLKAEYKIPRGWISTYKRIATEIGINNGARVVGNALAKNPFPIMIPCHRAIKSNGELGGFQGGIEMKRSLLKMEGVEFSDKGKAITKRIYY